MHVQESRPGLGRWTRVTPTGTGRSSAELAARYDAMIRIYRRRGYTRISSCPRTGEPFAFEQLALLL